MRLWKLEQMITLRFSYAFALFILYSKSFVCISFLYYVILYIRCYPMHAIRRNKIFLQESEFIRNQSIRNQSSSILKLFFVLTRKVFEDFVLLPIKNRMNYDQIDLTIKWQWIAFNKRKEILKRQFHLNQIHAIWKNKK